MSLKIEISENAREIARQLREFPQEMARGVAAAMAAENHITIAYITDKKMRQRGPTTLGAVSRTLSRSLRATKAKTSASGVESSIGTNVKYAGAHEYGSKPHVIRPRNGKFLRFMGRNGVVFARFVNHPGLPARAPIGTGIAERKDNYSRALSEAIENAWRT